MLVALKNSQQQILESQPAGCPKAKPGVLPKLCWLFPKGLVSWTFPKGLDPWDAPPAANLVPLVAALPKLKLLG